MSARRTYSRDDVETHYGSDRPAVNVKVYDSLADGYRKFQGYAPADIGAVDPRFTLDWIEEHVSDDYASELFWEVCRWEWETIESDAEEVLGVRAKDVVQDGRSGGWCVITGLPEFEEWDAIQLAKWRKFERYAKATAGDIMYRVVDSIYTNEFNAWRDEESERLGSEAFAVVAP